MNVHKIILSITAICLMTLPARAAIGDAAYALMDKIESFEEQRNFDTTAEEVANFYAGISAEVLTLPWAALQLVRSKCKDPAILMLFPDVDSESEYENLLLHIKHTLPHITYKRETIAAKYILINTNTQAYYDVPIYGLIIETARMQKLHYFCLHSDGGFRINREKQGSFSDFILYVLKKQEEWCAENPAKWAICDDY